MRTRTRKFWKFCTTFMPVPGTFGCSVRPCHNTRGPATSCFVPARSFCELCTPVPQYPELLEVLHEFRTRTRNFWKFCKIPIPLPGTSVTSVDCGTIPGVRVCFCYNTRGALYSCRFNPKSVLWIMASYLVNHTNRIPNTGICIIQ